MRLHLIKMSLHGMCPLACPLPTCLKMQKATTGIFAIGIHLCHSKSTTLEILLICSLAQPVPTQKAPQFSSHLNQLSYLHYALIVSCLRVHQLTHQTHPVRPPQSPPQRCHQLYPLVYQAWVRSFLFQCAMASNGSLPPPLTLQYLFCSAPTFAFFQTPQELRDVLSGDPCEGECDPTYSK